MKWIIDNWSLLVVLAVVICLIAFYIRKFTKMPTDEQIRKIKEWLLYAVVMAEKELGSGTGQIKLRYVYNMFMEKFPSFVPIVPFELFSIWVDEALKKMRKMLESNKNLAEYVGILDGNESSDL